VFAELDFRPRADIVFGFFERCEEGGNGLTVNLHGLEQGPAFGVMR